MTSDEFDRMVVQGAVKLMLENEKNFFTPQIADDYERGFIDGMQKQMQSSVDKAVNKMAKKEWVSLTDEEILEEYRQSYGDDGNLTDVYFARAVEAKLKEKNT